MREHTKEPWRVAHANPSPTTGEWMIAGAKPGYLAEVRDCGSGDVKANAHRIVACVNACAGLRDDELEGGVVPARNFIKAREQLAECERERDELKATIGYETQYKKAYIELSGKTGELETKINELRNKVQKTEAERDHYHRERDIWVRSNKQLQEQLASVKKERDELVAALEKINNVALGHPYAGVTCGDIGKNMK